MQYKETMEIEEAAFITAQIALGLDHLHNEKSVVHRDLKPENIMFQSDGYIKICDFNFSKRIEGGECRYTLCGTPEYIAPEIILNKGHGKPVDWWAFGVLLYEMLYGAGPFSYDDPMDVFEAILDNRIYYPSDKKFTSAVRKMLKRCFGFEVCSRLGTCKPALAEVQKHQFWKHLNFDEIKEGTAVAAYIPEMDDSLDLRHFAEVSQETMEEPEAIPQVKDPFIDW
jgi:serine/threonine protein kinase